MNYSKYCTLLIKVIKQKTILVLIFNDMETSDAKPVFSAIAQHNN